MGATGSSPSNSNTNQIRKLRSKHLSKQEIRNNIQSLIANTNNNLEFTDPNETLNWNTDSNSTLGYRDSMVGGTMSESENLRKLNKFISNLNSDSEQNFDSYQNEIQNLERYINQNGGFDVFEGRPLNIINSNYLEKIRNSSKFNMVAGGESDSDVSSLGDLDNDNDEIDMYGGALYNEEINNLDKYIVQNGGYDVFEGRLLNIVNSNVLAKLQKNITLNPLTETSISTLNFTNSQNGGNNLLSATSINTINNMNGDSILSSTSNGSKITKQSAGSVGTFSATSINSRENFNIQNLPDFSDTSFSDSVMKGGNRRESLRNERRDKKNDDSSSTSELDDSSNSSSESDDELNNNDDTESSDDTIKMARMIARQREVSDSIKDSENPSSSSSVSDSSNEDEDELESSTTNDSSDSPKEERQQSRTKKVSSKNKKNKKTKKLQLSENSLSTEFKAVPFYSSENSTDFYRSYQNKNRFN